jgi:DNA adenine methylase
LKWCGGKGRLASRILAKLPARIGTYYEPFLGGGAVFFELARTRRFERAVIGDKCPELMNAFQAVRDQVDDLVRELRQSQYKYDRESFLDIRRADPDKMTPVVRAARTIYLNKTCFNGLHRVNSKGQFNTPFGRYENPVTCDEANLRACSEALQMAELAESDFENICTDAGPGDAVYYDPPYLPISNTANFTQYTSGGFAASDHLRLVETFKRLDGAGVAQVLSNSSAAGNAAWFCDFEVEVVTGTRSVGRPDKRTSVPEILVSNCAECQ